MTSDPKTVPFIVDQARAACDVRTGPVIGECDLYCDAKMRRWSATIGSS